MLYDLFTGDIHGNVNGVADFINKVHPTMEDVIVLLGDVGANYYNGRKDHLMKQWLNDSGTRFLCIHGNHEMRQSMFRDILKSNGAEARMVAARISEPDLCQGRRDLYDEWFAVSRNWRSYSVDKYYRLSRGWSWWPDEHHLRRLKLMLSSRFARNTSTLFCPIPVHSNMNQQRCFLAH